MDKRIIPLVHNTIMALFFFFYSFFAESNLLFAIIIIIFTFSRFIITFLLIKKINIKVKY